MSSKATDRKQRTALKSSDHHNYNTVDVSKGESHSNESVPFVVNSRANNDDSHNDGRGSEGRDSGTSTLPMSIKLQQARKAFDKMDPSVSKQLHMKSLAQSSANTENHKKHGEFIKSIIFGGLDGVFTCFALVAGFQGAGSSFHDAAVMLVFGFANVVADALSMGIGDFLSEKAENDFAISERARESWEFENYKKGEIDEMIEIYMSKGVSYDDASVILNRMAKYPDFFIDHMMIQELEIYPINTKSDDYDPYESMKKGVVTFMSFLIFGSIPLLSFVIFEIIQVTDEKDLQGTGVSVADLRFYVCIALAVITLMTLGLVKGKLTESNLLTSTVFVTLNGVIAASASYLIGWGLGKAVGFDG